MQSLADRFAEAFAEHLHERIRKEFWGYKADEQLSNEELIKEICRYSPCTRLPCLPRAL